MCEWDNLTEMCSLKRCQHGNVEDCEFATNGGAENCTQTTPYREWSTTTNSCVQFSRYHI